MFDTSKEESRNLPKNAVVMLLVKYDARKWTAEKANSMYSNISNYFPR